MPGTTNMLMPMHAVYRKDAPAWGPAGDGLIHETQQLALTGSSTRTDGAKHLITASTHWRPARLNDADGGSSPVFPLLVFCDLCQRAGFTWTFVPHARCPGRWQMPWLATFAGYETPLEDYTRPEASQRSTGRMVEQGVALPPRMSSGEARGLPDRLSALISSSDSP